MRTKVLFWLTNKTTPPDTSANPLVMMAKAKDIGHFRFSSSIMKGLCYYSSGPPENDCGQIFGQIPAALTLVATKA
jgi:hypothetical protein